MMASNARELQLREPKDTISQLKTMLSEQTELIRSLRLIIEEKSSREKELQEQVDYLTKKLFGTSSERRSDDIPGQQELFNEAEMEQDPSSFLEDETVIHEHTRKKKATHKELFRGDPCGKSSHPSARGRTDLSGLWYPDGPDRGGIYPPGTGIHPRHLQGDRILQPELWLSSL